LYQLIVTDSLPDSSESVPLIGLYVVIAISVLEMCGSDTNGHIIRVCQHGV